MLPKCSNNTNGSISNQAKLQTRWRDYSGQTAGGQSKTRQAIQEDDRKFCSSFKRVTLNCVIFDVLAVKAALLLAVSCQRGSRGTNRPLNMQVGLN